MTLRQINRLRSVFLSFALIEASSAAAQLQPRVPSDPAAIVEKQRKDSASLAGEWIHSQNARTRAWGASLVLRDRQTTLIPDLLQLADNYLTNGEPASLAETDDHNAMLAILDTLVQMNAAVPADTATKLYREFPAQSIILLSNVSSEAAPALLHIFETEKAYDGAWVAAGNLLAKQRTPGFANAILSDMVVHATVTVRLGQDAFGPGAGGGFGGSYFREPWTGWPAIGTYSLSACGAERATVLVSGVHPAYYWRAVNDLYGTGGDTGCPLDKDVVRADYLATLLLSNREHLPLPSQVTHSVEWTGSTAYLAELSQFIADQQALFAEVRSRLQSAGLMAGPESESPGPVLAITITDLRQTRTPELPVLTSPTPGVTISSF